ncbi:MAG: IS66 family transposase [Bacteroidia bacterium]
MQQQLTYEELLQQNILQAEVIKSQAEKINKLEELEGKYFLLQQQFAQMQRMIFGSKSERFVPVANPSQATLEFNIEPAATLELKQEQVSAHTRTTVEKKTNHKGRLKLPAHLERVEHKLDPTEDVTALKCIGEEITEELEYTPGKFFVNKYIRKKYAKPGGEGIITAALPTRPIDKGIPGPGLLSQIVIDKYVDHLPLHRQVQRFKREDIHIPASTITDWVKYTGNLLAPLYEVLKQQVLKSDYIMADESPIKVLDSEKENGTCQGYYWVYRSPVKNLVLFDYRPGRGREGPKEILKDFSGHLQTDGYPVYEMFEKQPGITLLSCMAHARRYFEQALDNDKARAEFALQQIQLLYEAERTARTNNYTPAQRLELRKSESMSVLESIKQWLGENVTLVLPQSAIGKAITYSLARWEKLCVYVTDGKLEIDNNWVENNIRPIALGRKNYLFAGSHDAAQRAAIIYSLLITCKIKNVNPFTWLKQTLSIIPDTKATNLIELLPR